MYLIALIAHYVLYLHKKSAILLQLCHCFLTDELGETDIKIIEFCTSFDFH